MDNLSLRETSMNLSSGIDNDKMAYYLEKKKINSYWQNKAKLNALERKVQITDKNN